MLTRVLLALPRGRLRTGLERRLDQPGIVTDRLPPRPGFWPRLVREAADLVVVPRHCVPEPCEASLELLRQAPESPDLVVLSRQEEPEDRARLLAAGAKAVLPEQLDPEVLRQLIASLLDERRKQGVRRLQAAAPGGPPRLADFVSASPAMQAFMAVVEQVASSDSALLIVGETGVGKERLARAIHAEGRRSDQPFVAINCAALPEGLLESELFGHEEGAFTGATRSRRGRFELAHDGTLFLDEIGELPVHVQAKLLRVLQEQEFQPVGSERSIRVDVRVMAASNRDLEEAVEAGTFRRDLFYRLGVIVLEVPPLRERREDIATLADSYVGHFRQGIPREVEGISPEALAALQAHDWPGNVRELINAMERGVLLARGPEILLEDLPEAVAAAGNRTPGLPRLAAPTTAGDGAPPAWLARPWAEIRHEVLREAELRYLAAHLRATGGRIGETASRAGLSPRSLHQKMRRHGLRKEDFRGA
jgi:DNA-binding NtrC family response regulator